MLRTAQPYEAISSFLIVTVRKALDVGEGNGQGGQYIPGSFVCLCYEVYELAEADKALTRHCPHINVKAGPLLGE